MCVCVKGRKAYGTVEIVETGSYLFVFSFLCVCVCVCEGEKGKSPIGESLLLAYGLGVSVYTNKVQKLQELINLSSLWKFLLFTINNKGNSSNQNLRNRSVANGVDLGGGCRRCAMTCGFLIQLVYCIRICLRHQSVPPFLIGAPILRKILDPPLVKFGRFLAYSRRSDRGDGAK